MAAPGTPQQPDGAEGAASFPVIPKRGTGNVHLKRKRRKKKAHLEEGPAEELNLTAMMDMMTIILVFLLKSYSTSSIDVKAGVDLQLPPSTTKLPPVDATTITITKKAVLIDNKPIVEVRGGALDPSVKREGANGYFVEPLWVRLQKIADLQKTLVRQGKLKEFKGQAVVVADKTIPFRLLSEIIYSAGQAEFHSFKFLLIKKGG